MKKQKLLNFGKVLGIIAIVFISYAWMTENIYLSKVEYAQKLTDSLNNTKPKVQYVLNQIFNMPEIYDPCFDPVYNKLSNYTLTSKEFHSWIDMNEHQNSNKIGIAAKILNDYGDNIQKVKYRLTETQLEIKRLQTRYPSKFFTNN